MLLLNISNVICHSSVLHITQFVCMMLGSKNFFWSLVLSQGLRRGTPWTGRQLTQRQTHIHNYGQFTSSLYCERKPEYTENAHQHRENMQMPRRNVH